MCATPDGFSSWDRINVKKAYKVVKKLQKRIGVAFIKRRKDVVTYLQNQLIHSFYAKYISVKIVSSNKGRNTPGIDGVIWNTSNLKFDAIDSLNIRDYKPKPLKKIYVPKGIYDKRPLSIPTMKDRAMQTLYKLALEPISCVTADKNSYAYLPNRSCRDAVIQMIQALQNNPEYCWVLKTDIESCFCNISHEWILNNIPMDKEILRKFLKCGCVDNGEYHPIHRGIPQGGCLSSVICNMTLDGLENLLDKRCCGSISYFRYADDILVFSRSFNLLEQSVLPTINDFLLERGLHLSFEKTSIIRLNNEYSFLGYTIHKEGNRIIVVPSRKSIDNLLNNLYEVFERNKFNFSKEVYSSIKMIIKGVMNYFEGIVEEQSLYGVEFEVVSLVNELVGNAQIVDYFSSLFDENY